MTPDPATAGPPKGPWYKHFAYWNAEALKYLNAFRKLPINSLHHLEFAAFERLSDWRLVFESNLIEGVGLPQGETRKIVEEYFPLVPSTYEDFRHMTGTGIFSFMALAEEDLRRLTDAVKHGQLAAEQVKPCYSFAGKSKGTREVEQHFFALIDARATALAFKRDLSLHRLLTSLLARHGEGPELMKEWQERTGLKALEAREFPCLLSEAVIRDLHATVAEGLMPEDAGVKAGEYRIDIRSVDYDVAFPAPDLVPNCMKHYVQTANGLISKVFTEGANPFETAAKVSYDLVRIHPFSDFNGRVSRLVLVMVLIACDVPFAVTLRGGKKERHRYLRALQSANSGDTLPYATLIAMTVAETFAEVDENLQRAGLSSLLAAGQ